MLGTKMGSNPQPWSRHDSYEKYDEKLGKSLKSIEHFPQIS